MNKTQVLLRNSTRKLLLCFRATYNTKTSYRSVIIKFTWKPHEFQNDRS